MAEAPPSVLAAALRCRCPRCGRGKLFAGVLTVRDRCQVCGLDLRAHDAGDGPAVAVILVLGAIVMALAFWVEFHFAPPLWVHAILWPAITLPVRDPDDAAAEGGAGGIAVPPPRLGDGAVSLPADALPSGRAPVQRLPVRRLIGPALMTAVMFLVLIGLGTWQVRRLAWKEGILAQIARAEAAPPVPLSSASGTPVPAPFTKVAVTGTLLHDKSALYGAEVRDTAAGPELGAQLIEPLQRDGAPPLLVDRGWVPLKRRIIRWRCRGGTVTIAGYRASRQTRRGCSRRTTMSPGGTSTRSIRRRSAPRLGWTALRRSC